MNTYKQYSKTSKIIIKLTKRNWFEIIYQLMVALNIFSLHFIEWLNYQLHYLFPVRDTFLSMTETCTNLTYCTLLFSNISSACCFYKQITDQFYNSSTCPRTRSISTKWRKISSCHRLFHWQPDFSSRKPAF